MSTRYVLESRDEPGRYFVSESRSLRREGYGAVITSADLSKAMWWDYASLALFQAVMLPGRWTDVAVTADQMVAAEQTNETAA